MSELSAEEHKKKSTETLRIIKEMEAALGENSNNMSQHFHENFRWMGNYGCGTKQNLQQFRNNWQLPFRAAFTERTYKTEKFLVDGDWASCFGHIEAWVSMCLTVKGGKLLIRAKKSQFIQEHWGKEHDQVFKKRTTRS